MQNRNWDHRPNQNGGRSAHDYGHTHLPVEPAKSRWGLPIAVGFGLVLWIAIGRVAVYLISGH